MNFFTKPRVTYKLFDAMYLIFISIIIQCGQRSMFQNIRCGDYSTVEVGTYHGTTIFLRDGGDYKKPIDLFREDIESNGDVMPILVKHYFTVPDTLNFIFKFALFDRTTNVFILRYFARIYDHPIFAGYQIQFVYDAKSRLLRKIFTAEVPLE